MLNPLIATVESVSPPVIVTLPSLVLVSVYVGIATVSGAPYVTFVTLPSTTSKPVMKLPSEIDAVSDVRFGGCRVYVVGQVRYGADLFFQILPE